MNGEGLPMEVPELHLEFESDVSVADAFHGMCRLCATTRFEHIPVFSSKGKELQLADKIHSYLPIMVTGDDILPQTVCEHCIQRLEACHDLVLTCLKADAVLREIYGFGDVIAQKHGVTTQEHAEISVPVEKSDGTGQYEYISVQTGEYQSVVPSVGVEGTNTESIPPLLQRDLPYMEKIVNSQTCDRTEASIKLQSVDLQTEFSLDSVLDSDPDLLAPKENLPEINHKTRAENDKFKVHKVRLATSAPISQTINVIKRTTPLYPRREDICPLCNYEVINDRNKYRAHIETHLQAVSPQWGSDPFNSSLSRIQKKVLKHITHYDGVWELDSSLLPPDDELSKVIEEKSSVKFSSLNLKQQESVVSRLLQILGNDDVPVLEKSVSTQQMFKKRQFSPNPAKYSHAGIKPPPRNVAHGYEIKSSVGPKTQLAQPSTAQPVVLKSVQEDVLKYKINSVQKEFHLPLEDHDFQSELELSSEVINNPQTITEWMGVCVKEPELEEEGISQENEEKCLELNKSDSVTSLKENVATGPVQCKQCGKLLQNCHKLLIHMRMHSDLKCLDCGKEFVKKSLLNRHSAKHTGEKNHVCQYCGRTFRFFETLRSHEKMHTSSIKCEKCGRNFTKEKCMQDHKCRKANPRVEALLKCSWCPRKFVREDCLKRHEESHEESSHLCETCGKWFKNKMYLRKHKEIHLDQQERASKRVPCELCDKTFQNLHKLRIHMFRHKGERPFPCEICGKAFSCKQTLRQHLATHGEAKYACPHCDKRFNRKGNMQVHINRHTQNARSTLPFTCRTCGEKFSDRGRYTSHCITHTAVQRSQQTIDPTPCQECGKIFTNSHMLNIHLRRERMQKEGWVYSCRLCPSTFTTNRSRKFHEYTHGLKPDFQCKICNRVFITRTSLVSHERLHRGERPFACGECTRQFSSQHSLYQHLRNVHVTDPPHKCEICGSRFKRAAALRVHQSTHSDERPYECDVCGSTFKTKGDRHTHRKRHINAPPLPSRSYVLKPEELSSVCNVSGLAFETEEDYSVHAEKIHAVKSEQQSLQEVVVQDDESKNDLATRSIQGNETYPVGNFTVGNRNDIVIENQEY